MQKKYFTIEDLISFCKHKKMYNFSSKESGKPLYVQAVQDFSSADIEKAEDNKLYANHSNMIKRLDSMKTELNKMIRDYGYMYNSYINSES